MPASRAPALRRVFLRDLTLECLIGVKPHEKKRRQPIVINLELDVAETGRIQSLADVVCYDDLTQRIKALLARGHVGLIETLAEDIAALALEDPRVRLVRLRIEKPQAIAEAASVGIAIERRQKRPLPRSKAARQEF